MNFIYTVFGWPLGWIMYVCYLIVKNYGLALILFTLITKALQLPLAIKQQKSMMKTAIFKPQMDALQRKYKNNREKLNEEMMKLYEKEHYNPMSGCLPTLISFPILFGMIDVIYKPITHIIRPGSGIIEKATEILTGLGMNTGNTMASQISVINSIQADPAPWSELGADFIAKAQSMDFSFLGVNLAATPTLMPNGQPMSVYLPLLLVPILSGITSLFISIQSQRQNKATMGDMAGGGMMKGMMYFMPLFSLWFAFQVPAGVGMYWLLSNVLTMVQTAILHKKFDPTAAIEAARAAEEAEREKEREERRLLKEKKAQGKQLDEKENEKAMNAKELNAKKIAEARRRMAEKYGDVYTEDEE